jgi:hypothetical protein
MYLLRRVAKAVVPIQNSGEINPGTARLVPEPPSGWR